LQGGLQPRLERRGVQAAREREQGEEVADAALGLRRPSSRRARGRLRGRPTARQGRRRGRRGEGGVDGEPGRLQRGARGGGVEQRSERRQGRVVHGDAQQGQLLGGL